MCVGFICIGGELCASSLVMKDIITRIIILLLSLSLLVWIAKPIIGKLGKTETIVRCDTITLYDTIKVVEPIVKDSVIVRTEKVYLPIVSTDTLIDSVQVEVPIMQKVYSDSLYTAWVSGFRPNLDSLHIYNKEKIITIETIERERQKRFGIGIVGGAGTDFQHGLQPFVGIGIYYSLISF